MIKGRKNQNYVWAMTRKKNVIRRWRFEDKRCRWVKVMETTKTPISRRSSSICRFHHHRRASALSTKPDPTVVSLFMRFLFSTIEKKKNDIIKLSLNKNTRRMYIKIKKDFIFHWTCLSVIYGCIKARPLKQKKLYPLYHL